MTIARARFLIAALLFVGWLGFLLYLVQNRHMVVLPRPQFLAAPLVVIAEVRDGNGGPAPTVTVESVAWADGLKAAAGQDLVISNLPGPDAKQGYTGPGRYILPLEPDGSKAKDSYRVVPVPLPGFGEPSGAPIYPATPQTQGQLDEMVRQRGG